MHAANRSLGAANLEPALRELFFRELFGLGILFLRLLDRLILLRQDDLHMAGAVHVGVDATVRAVRAPAPLLSLAHTDVSDCQVLGIQILELGIALSIGEKAQDDLGRLHRPAALRHLEGFSLRRPPDAAFVNPEGHAFLLCANVLQVSLRPPQVHALDGIRSLVGVFVVHPEVGTHRLAALAGIGGLHAELDHSGWGVESPGRAARGEKAEALCADA
mmetsp:Transcript_106146/g.265856  ORF Transcript_106146/g.265856 Transcript_106146/m.265856 type:complete len:218 (-) Transcript_106146:7-660(-)